jgi:HEAT repeat protein/GT2 family glycosyltransferase
MEISVIVRFHNEEKYLDAVMQALSLQDFPWGEYEIIGVDNRSEDNSRMIVNQYTTKVLSIDNYQPGKALNLAISQASGKYIAILSAHTIPASRKWMATLYKHMATPKIAGVYGAQLYHINAKFLDKRDLDIFARNQPRIERVNSDFWNANSMFPRVVWEKQPFDERVFELEDHYWTKILLPLGYEIHFEPQALVYHYGHMSRNDREHLADSALTDRQQISAAIAVLEKGDNVDWPETMMAGLTLASLTHSNHIENAVEALGRTLLNHWDFDVRWRVAGALGKIPCKESVFPLVKALSDQSFYARDEAAWSLARLGRIAVQPVLDHIAQLNVGSIPFAALALGLSGDQIGEEHAISLLIEEIKSGDKERIRNAIYFAGEIVNAQGSADLIPYINEFLQDYDDWLVAVCCWALGCFAKVAWESVKWGDIQALALGHSDEIVRFEATVAVGRAVIATKDTDLQSILLTLLHDQSNRVRYGAAQSLRSLIQNGVCNLEFDFSTIDDDFGVQYELGLIKALLQEGASISGFR